MNIPYYKNNNGLRCTQACLKMILKNEGRNFSFAKLDDLTNRHKKQLTYNGSALLAMSRLGFNVKAYSGLAELDYTRWHKDGLKYLKGMWKPSVLKFEAEHTDLNLQRKIAGQVKKYVVQKPAIMQDMIDHFSTGWYVIASVNLNVLKGRSGFCGHSVLMTGFDNRSITIHDPDLGPNRRLTDKQFLACFLDNILLFKPKKEIKSNQGE